MDPRRVCECSGHRRIDPSCMNRCRRTQCRSNTPPRRNRSIRNTRVFLHHMGLRLTCTCSFGRWAHTPQDRYSIDRLARNQSAGACTSHPRRTRPLCNCSPGFRRDRQSLEATDSCRGRSHYCPNIFPMGHNSHRPWTGGTHTS